MPRPALSCASESEKHPGPDDRRRADPGRVLPVGARSRFAEALCLTRSVHAEPTPASEPPGRAEPLRLVTLGDGYTAGTDTGAARRDSWPAQLAVAMDHGDLRLRLVDNLAESGHTSADVERVQLPQVAALEPDVVTLQVGVNDIIAGTSAWRTTRSTWPASSTALLAIVPPDHLFLITTPDHTLTARGGDYGPRDAGQADVAGGQRHPGGPGSGAGDPGHRHLRRSTNGSPTTRAWWWARGPTPAPSSTPAGWRSSVPGCAGCSWERSRSTLGATCPAGPVRPVSRSREASKEDV